MKRTTLLAVCTIMFAACSRMDMYVEDSGRQPVSEIKVNIKDFTAYAGTRTQETGYQTSFTGEEQIGVFAILGNSVLHNNIPYKYNASSGSWALVNGSDKIYAYGNDGVTYYAYYPYSSAMNGKKSVAEIAAAFTPPEDQGSYEKYTSADLMTGAGTLSGSSLTFAFAHAMSLIEIEIEEKTDVAIATPNPVFYNMTPWKMTDGKYRYIVRPGTATEVAFEYGPADNRCSYLKTLLPADVTAGNYKKIKATFDNINMVLNTGSYTGSLGTLSKVIIDGREYSLTQVPGKNNEYTINRGRTFTTPVTSFEIYINDNQVNTEHLLLSATPSKVQVDASAKTITVSLSAGGMEGAGNSATDPYLVTTAVQLRGVGLLGVGNNDAETEYYEQKNDIDLSMYTDWNPVKSGKLYDGKHYKINNLVSTKGGVFSYNGGTIQNVHLASGTITVENGTVGGITNWSVNAKIYNCSNAATIKTNFGNSGGIAGDIQGSSLVSHCKNTGPITAISRNDNTGNCGGIVGESHAHTNCLLEYCYNTGNINGLFRNGGIINLSYTPIKYCYSIGDVSESARHSWGYIASEFSGNLPITDCWSAKKPFASTRNDEISGVCTLFNAVGTNSWPVYDSGTGDGWTSEHWKPFSKGEYPKLFWEE